MWAPIVGGSEVKTEYISHVENPSSGSSFESVFVDIKGDVTKSAIDEAEAAFEKFSKTPLSLRAKILISASEALEQKLEDAAILLAMEGGKPIKDARVEVKRSVMLFRAAAEEARFILEGKVHRVDAYEYPPGNEGRLVLEVREAIGTVGAILPFNFPFNSFAHKVAPNIAVGNTVVVKPASATPLSSLFIAKLLYRAGLPRGVLSVIPGPASSVGDAIISSKKVSGITFTGSTGVGMSIASRAYDKRLMLEMGGSDPMIMLEDADLSKAVNVAVRARFEHAGQNCNATKRILVHSSLYERFLSEYAKAVSGLTVGDALSEKTDVGPLINDDAVGLMEAFVKDAVEHGAKVLTGGSRLKGPGHFFQPTVLADVPLDSAVMKEEVFGPVAPVVKFESDEEALRIANTTKYGLQASVFTADIRRALRLSRYLQVGGVIINDTTRLRWDSLPFGGLKASGLGAREGVRSTIETMSEPKLISVGL